MLRRASTDAEAVLWAALRDRALGGLKFRRQHAFDRFILDFYCADARLVVELDGPCHQEPAQLARDEERTLHLQHHDLLVLRFSNEVIQHDLPAVLTEIARTAHPRLTPSSSPSPAKRERGPGGEGLSPDALESPT